MKTSLKINLKYFQLPCKKKKFFKKEVDSLKVEIKHIKRENYKIHKRHKLVTEKFSDLEEETMTTVTKKKKKFFSPQV